jgi:hypothetical protein
LFNFIERNPVRATLFVGAATMFALAIGEFTFGTLGLGNACYTATMILLWIGIAEGNRPNPTVVNDRSIRRAKPK